MRGRRGTSKDSSRRERTVQHRAGRSGVRSSVAVGECEVRHPVDEPVLPRRSRAKPEAEVPTFDDLLALDQAEAFREAFFEQREEADAWR